MQAGLCRETGQFYHTAEYAESKNFLNRRNHIKDT